MESMELNHVYHSIAILEIQQFEPLFSYNVYSFEKVITSRIPLTAGM